MRAFAVAIGVLAVSASAVASPSFGKLPLAFEANRGQAPSDARFVARLPGYELALTDEGATLTRGDLGSVRMRLLGASAKSSYGVAPLPTRVNYFLGNDPAKWQRGVTTFRQVRFERVYPGIDLVYYGKDGQLEYDFVVAPGADPRKIALRFDGASRVQLDRSGDVLVTVGEGALTLHRPRIYQEKSGARHEVRGRFTLEKNTVRFVVENWDRARPLVIDPTVDYATFLGGEDNEQGRGVAVDKAGFVYVTGFSRSKDFVTVPTVTLTSGQQAERNVFVTKISPDGDFIVYSTVFGGSGPDEGFGIVLNPAGEAYLTGFTQSDDFPNVGQSAATRGGARDAFVTKLGVDGAVVMSRFFGGTGDEEAYAIALDSMGRIYITGFTANTNFPFFGNQQGPAVGGASEAFVAGFVPNGTTSLFATRFGGPNEDEGRGLALDGSGNLLVAGTVGAGGIIPSANAFKPNASGQDCFVLRYSVAGDGSITQTYATYVGASGVDQCYGVAAYGNEIVAVGETSSDGTNGFPNPSPTPVPTPTPGPAAFGTPPDGFLVKLDPTKMGGSQLNYWQPLNGNAVDRLNAIVIRDGWMYVGGETRSDNLFAFGTPTPGGGKAGFFARLVLPSLDKGFPTYVGGATGTGFGAEGVAAIAVDDQQNAYLVGSSNGSFQQPRINAIQSIHGGQLDAYLIKIGFRPVSLAPSVATVSPSTGPTAGGTKVTLTGANFLPGAKVTFGGVQSTSVQFVNSTTLIATTPPHNPSPPNAGDTVLVTNPDGQVSAGGIGFVYFDLLQPTLSFITPGSGPTDGHTSVIISGQNFRGTATVKFGGTDATNISVINSTTILAVTPAHAAGAVSVDVTIDGSSIGSAAFTYTAAPSTTPTLAFVTPSTGPTGGGTRVVLIGNNFVTGSTVSFGGTAATDVNVINSSTIIATTPAHMAGPVVVQVALPNGGVTAELMDGFTYAGTGTATELKVLAVVPDQGSTAGGEKVLIIGSGFPSNSGVTIGGASSSVTVIDSTQLIASTPAHAAGTVDVGVSNGSTTVTLTNGYKFVDPPQASGGCSTSTGAGAGGVAILGILLLALALRRRAT